MFNGSLYVDLEWIMDFCDTNGQKSVRNIYSTIGKIDNDGWEPHLLFKASSALGRSSAIFRARIRYGLMPQPFIV